MPKNDTSSLRHFSPSCSTTKENVEAANRIINKLPVDVAKIVNDIKSERSGMMFTFSKLEEIIKYVEENCKEQNSKPITKIRII